eukprot:scaffold26699_cov14-Tisochrysis_lutea.AAC.1
MVGAELHFKSRLELGHMLSAWDYFTAKRAHCARCTARHNFWQDLLKTFPGNLPFVAIYHPVR